MEKEKKANQS